MKSEEIQSPDLLLNNLDALEIRQKMNIRKIITLKNLLNYLQTKHRNATIDENNIHPIAEAASTGVKTELTTIKQVQNPLQPLRRCIKCSAHRNFLYDQFTSTSYAGWTHFKDFITRECTVTTTTFSFKIKRKSGTI